MSGLHVALTELPDGQVESSDFRIGRTFWKQPDVVHLHWPENTAGHPSVLRSAGTALGLLGSLTALKMRGASIIRTLHDDGNHHRRHPRIESLLRRQLDRLVDGYILLSDGQRQLLRGRRSGRPHVVIPLPSVIEPEQLASRADARRSLGLPGDLRLVGSIGRIHPYKQIVELIETALKNHDEFVATEPPIRLVVAGDDADGLIPSELVRRCEVNEGPIVRLEPLMSQQYLTYLRAMDVVVLPYRNHLNSGVVVDALAIGTRVAVTTSPAMQDLHEQFGSWVTLLPPIDDPNFTAALRSVVASDEPPSPAPSFPSMADNAIDTLDFYRQILHVSEEQCP